MLVCRRGSQFQVADFIGFVHFSWHSQSEIGNIDILVRKVCEKLKQLVHANQIWVENLSYNN